MEIIKGLIMTARLANKNIQGHLEDDRAEFQIGNINLNIYGGKKNEVIIAPTCLDMWAEPLRADGTIESVFYDIVDLIDESAVDYEDSPYRQWFPNLESLVKYIEKETGVVANEHPKHYTEESAGVIEFEEFKVVLFGPYHGTVYVPKDYQLNFVLDELP